MGNKQDTRTRQGTPRIWGKVSKETVERYEQIEERVREKVKKGLL